MPPWEVLLPESWSQRRDRRRILRAVRSDAPIVHLTHANCLDGASCTLLHWMRYGRDAIADIPLDPHEVAGAIDVIADGADVPKRLHISDLSVGTADDAGAAAKLRTLADRGWEIVWRDHHAGQWTEATRGLVDAAVERLVVDTEERYCAADLVQKDLLPDDEFAKELAEIVRDRDLWLREIPESDTLACAMNTLGAQGLKRVLFKTRDLDHPRIREAAEAWRERLAEEREQAKERTRIVENDHRVGVLYGDFTSSDTAQAIREELDTDVEVIMKPQGGVSLRAREGFDVSEVAREFGGGGHAQAAGCTLGLTAPEYLWYWLTRGGGPKPKALIEATRDLQPDAQAEQGSSKTADETRS